MKTAFTFVMVTLSAVILCGCRSSGSKSQVLDDDARMVIYDAEEFHTLRNLRLFLETRAQTLGRPGFTLGDGGIYGRPGSGNFTAHKFADLSSENWNLTLVFQVPTGARYVNSGVYLLYDDPRRNLDELPADTRQAYQEALNKAQSRRDRFGAGPFELDFFSHELQIIAGTDASIPPENYGPAAFYGITPGDGHGHQRLVTQYDLFFGDTYELRLEVRGLNRKAYLRSIAFQTDPILVSEHNNLTKAEDPVRGGVPVALLLQAFYNDGIEVKLPVFKRIVLEQF